MKKKPNSSRNDSQADKPGNASPGKSVIILWLVAGLILGLAAISFVNRAKTKPPVPAALDPARLLSFNKDVAPIIYDNCSTCHHPGESAPFSLLNYADVNKHARQIAEVTRRRIMPPWLPEPGYGDFIGQRYLTPLQIAMIQQWFDQGALEGNPGDAPPTPTWREGWQLGQPDLVIQLTQAYTLAADGPDVYRNFVIPIPLSSRRFVRAIEFSPGNGGAVHHTFMFLDATRDSRRRDAQDAAPGFPGLHSPPTAQAPAGYFLSWQPGKMASTNADDLAWALEKDTDFILQMHLRPTGKPEQIQPSVAFHFSDKPPTRTPLKFGLWSYSIDIAAGATNHVISDSYTLPVDVDVLRILPHTHYLGRQIHGVATLPDGTQKWLLRIENWDFNWQGDYTFSEPVFLPKGTTVSMQVAFDNSTNNARNPNHPPQRVKYGVNSSDEMAELWMQVLPRSHADAVILEKDFQPKVFNSTIAYNNYLLLQDPRNAKAYTEIGKASLFLNEPDEALQHFRRAIELQPDEDEPHYFFGLIMRLAGRLEDSKAAFRQTILLNPNHQKAHGNLGLILMDEGNLAEAELHFESALSINPEDNIAKESLLTIARKRTGVRN